MFIAQHKKTWPVDLICQLLGVTRSSYYDYLRRNQGKTDDPYHRELLEAVREIAKASDSSYGSRRMKKALNALSYPVSRHKAGKLMKEAKVQVKHRKKYKVTTNSNHTQPVFDNVLDRQFDVEQPDQVYVGDITYLWTQEGWLYLAVVIDLYARKVVGWSMGSRMNARLVTDALMMAIWQRCPKAGLIVHSDRGSQYASKAESRLTGLQGNPGPRHPDPKSSMCIFPPVTQFRNCTLLIYSKGSQQFVEKSSFEPNHFILPPCWAEFTACQT
ncbi:MAG: IS3 family transposase [Haliea sp.]|nr:IS3 family transposase [Haliea sp.]